VCLWWGLLFLTLKDLEADLCLLFLFLGLDGGDLLLDVGLGEGVHGGDLGVLDLLLGCDLEGGTCLMLTTNSLLEQE
jgi:hypothetical protein